MTHLYSGLGDWLFRSLAFPREPDNAEKYLNRFYPGSGQEGFRNKILELRSELPQILEEIITEWELDKAHLCGFTSMFQQTCASLALALILKRRNRGQTLIMGGPNCDAPMGEVLLKIAPQMDAVFSGPALKSFPAFVGMSLRKEGPKGRSIPGVYRQSLVQLATKGPTTGVERNINDEVLVDYRDFSARLKSDLGADLKPVIAFETSRGCWWGERAHCTFCGLNAEGMNYRSLEPDKAVKMFERMFSQVPDAVGYTAVDNILPKSYPSEALPHVRPPEGSYIFYEVKADLPEIDFQRLKEAQVTQVQPGIEALSTKTLKLMRKGTTAFTNIRFLKNCLTYSMTPVWNLLTGFPGEEAATFEKYLRDIPLLTHLPPPSGAFMVRFDRFSPYYVNRVGYELDLEPMDFYRFVYPLRPELLANMAYYFVDRGYGTYKIDALSWLEPLQEAVAQWVDGWKKCRPVLRLAGDGESVLDSRFSSTVDQPNIGVDGVRMLSFMSKRGAGRQELFSKAQTGGIENPEHTLGKLAEHRLIFEENDQYMSLVMPAEVQTACQSGDI